MYRNVKRSLVAATAMVLLLAGCGATDSSTANSTSGPIKIGAAVSDTGKFAIEGASTKHGYEMWADEVNGRGGIDVGGTMYVVRDKRAVKRRVGEILDLFPRLAERRKQYAGFPLRGGAPRA